jgi:hypothetical protein
MNGTHAGHAPKPGLSTQLEQTRCQSQWSK